MGMLRVETRISASNLQIGLIEGVGSLGSWVTVLGENDLHTQLSIKAREHKDSELVPPLLIITAPTSSGYREKMDIKG